MAGKFQFFLLFLVLLAPMSLFSYITPSESVDLSATTPHPSTPSQKLSSEEENIDSFDVNAKSGRWNVTSDDTTDDLITDSSLRLITTNNATSGGNAFDMDRGLRKTDGKFEYRSKADGGGNQTEYFRDVLGDSADFEEDTENALTDGSTTLSQSNGLLIVETTTQFEGFHFNLLNINPQVYSSIEVRIRGNGSYNMFWTTRESDATVIEFLPALAVTTEWLTATNIFTDTKNIGIIRLTTSSDSNNIDRKTEIEYVKIIGDLDFATHVEGEVEDTWDWEDSNEYFFDTFDNISDFNDGTTENWTAFDDTSIIHDSGFLKITDADSDPYSIQRTSLSISASTYKWMTLEFNASEVVNEITISDGANNQVCFEDTGWTSGSFHLFSCDLSSDGDWTGTETGLKIIFGMDTGFTIFLNFTFLYDVELGDLESEWNLSTNFEREHTNPNGYFVGYGINAVAFDINRFMSGDDFIDSSLFEIAKLRVRNPGDDLTIQLKASQTNDAGFNVISLGGSSTVDIASTFTEYTYNLSTDSDWTAIIDGLELVILSKSATFTGIEQIHIDYFLLLGHWEEIDSVIGLMDSSTKDPLLNITTHFFDQPNDPNYPNDTSLRFEIELLDESQEISYVFLSDNFTNLHDEWLRWKVSYNVLQSELKIEAKTDGNTRIFRVLYPDDFTVISGRPPSLFNLGQSPAIFVSTFSQPISWQELRIDYIEAPFKERDWFQIQTPSDSDWLEDSIGFARVQDTLSSEISRYKIVNPSLDSISGIMKMQGENTENLIANDLLFMNFTLAVVDFDDGEIHNLFSIYIAMSNLSGFFPSPWHVIWDGNNNLIMDHNNSLVIDNTLNSTMSFSISIREDRSIVDLSVASILDDSGTDIFDMVSTFDTSDFADNPSQEFVTILHYQVEDLAGDSEITMIFDSLSFTERDIFADIGNFLGDVGEDVAGIGKGPLDFIGNIFKEVGRFLGGIFKSVGDFIVLGLTVALSALQTALTSAIGAVTAAVDFVRTAVDAVTAAVVALPGQIGSAIQIILDALEIALETAIDLVAQAVDLVTAAVVAIGEIIDDVLDAVGSLLLLIQTFIVNILAAIVDWFTDTFIPALITLMFDVWDDIWTPILNLVGLKAFVDGIVQQDFTTWIADFVGLFGALASNVHWIIAIAIFFIFTLSFLTAQDSNGKINGFQAMSNMVNNGLKTGISTPDTSILGFSLGKIFIPLILIVYIGLKILIAAGTLPDIFGGLPI